MEEKHMIRKAVMEDIPQITQIYCDILDLEAAQKGHTGWVKGIYPSKATALESVEQGEMYVMEEDGVIVASAKLNQKQVPSYARAKWEYDPPEEEVMVIHTLTVSPSENGKGYGTAFIKYYEEFAREQGCRYLRMDTNAVNKPARALYHKLGYKEAGVVPCNFNGIKDVMLVCLEKYLG